MTTCAVILHYANDFHKVMKAATDCGVDRIILWDNSRINVGVGAGYANGIKRALEKTDCEFIWLLDDDNIPEKDALKILKVVWDHTPLVMNDAITCKRIGTNYGWSSRFFYYTPNAVLGLNLFDFSFTRKLAKMQFSSERYKNYDKLGCAMFGGLFFHRSLIDRIGFPDPKFRVYGGDYEWTSRMKGLYVSNKAIINEPEPQQNIYEATKGHVMFQRKFVTNRFKFFINFLAYWLYLLYKGEDEKRRGLVAGYYEH